MRDIRELKDSCKGEKCFILGNAPSLKDLPLRALEEEHSFFVNKAALNLPITLPYFCLANTDEFMQNRFQYKNVRSTRGTFLRRRIYNTACKMGLDDAYCIDTLPGRMDEGLFSFDLEAGIHDGHTVVLDCLQYAVYMGFSEIYIGGVELIYEKLNPYFYKTAEIECRIPINRALKSFEFAVNKIKEKNIHIAKIAKAPKLNMLEYVPYQKVLPIK